MKKLHWKRVLNDPDSTQPTIWRNMKESKVDLKEIEELFSQKPLVKKVSDISASELDESLVSNVDVKKIFDAKEQCAIEVGMRSLPKLKQLKEALKNYD